MPLIDPLPPPPPSLYFNSRYGHDYYYYSSSSFSDSSLFSQSTPELSLSFSLSLVNPFPFIPIPIWVLPSSPISQMGRRQNDSEPSRFISLSFLLVGLISCALVYTVLSVVLNPNISSKGSNFESLELTEESSDGGCCRGIEKLELWGAAVKWGSDFKFNSSKECCQACKAMCTGIDGPCLCDTWVFCGNKKACGSKFGEVRLKTGVLYLVLIFIFFAGILIVILNYLVEIVDYLD